MKPSLFSHREKLLLGLLCSSMVFSLSFSLASGAVNQSKVNSIMDMVTAAANKFSDVIASGQSKSERTLYYEKVDAGLGDAVEMLAVVRNKIRSDYLGLSPAYTADEIVGQIIGGVIGNPGTGNPGTGGGNMNPMALCSTDSTLETIAWPHPTRGSYNPLMSVTDTKSKVFTFTVPSGGTSMTISYASTPTNRGKRIQKLYYTLSKQKACTYGDTSIGWSNTLQGGGTLNFPVSSENISGPYTGNPKLTPGETYYLSFKAQQPLTSDTDKNAPFDLIVEGGTSGGNLGGTSSVWSSASSLSCPTSVAALQSANPSTYNASTNTSGYQYANISGIYVNIKDYTNPSDTSLPTSCTPGKKWISKSGANSCSIFTCQGSVTTPPTIPPIPGSSDLGIFAGDPIPAPCPANTKLMNEILGGPTNGSWIRRPANEGSQAMHHVYRFITTTPDPTNTLGRVEWGDYQSPGFINVKVSPYPCDFATEAELTSAHGTDPVHWNGTWGAKCGGEGISGYVSYYMEGTTPVSGHDKCKLKPGVVYYVNISAIPTGNGAYDLIDRGIDSNTTRPMWGIYKTYEDYVAKQFTPNVSSQNPESLRQKVVNDYKTTGKNTDTVTISGTYGGSTVANTWTTKTWTSGSTTITATGPQYATVNTTLVYKVFAPNTSGGYYLGGSTIIPTATALANAKTCPSGVSEGSSSGKPGNRTTFENLNIECKISDTIYQLDYPNETYNLCAQHGGQIDVRGDCIVNGNGNYFR